MASVLDGIKIAEAFNGKAVYRGKCVACDKESVCFDGKVCPACVEKGIKWAAMQANREETENVKNSG